MKVAVPKLKGLKATICKVDHIIFLAVKYDIFSVLQPMNKMLQDSSLFSPELTTLCSTTLSNIKKLRKLLDTSGEAAFEHMDLFPQTKLNKV